MSGCNCESLRQRIADYKEQIAAVTDEDCSLKETFEALKKRIAELELQLAEQRERAESSDRAVKDLEPRAEFGDQCYQDRCENAYVEASVVRSIEGELAEGRKNSERLDMLANLAPLQINYVDEKLVVHPYSGAEFVADSLRDAIDLIPVKKGNENVDGNS